MIFILSNFVFSQEMRIKFQLSNHSNTYYKYSHYDANLKITHENWSLLINPEIVDKYVGKQILGTNFSREKFMGRFKESILTYEKDNLIFQFGRSPIKWGKSYNQSIIQSGQAPSYDHGYFKLDLSNFSAEFLVGQLGSERFKSDRILRLISGRRFSGSFFNNKLNISFGEQVIYTGENRNYEIFYLNPAIPYVFAAYEDNDLDVGNKNNDNSMIFFEGSYLMGRKYFIYFEFIIDDIQIYNDPVQDMLGTKIGAKSETNIFGFFIDWEAEYTEIDTWTYIHSGRGQFTSWENLSHPIGYPYGGDLKSIRVSSQAWLKRDRLSIETIYNWLDKGSVNIGNEWGNVDNLQDPFPSDPVKTFNLFQSALGFHSKNLSILLGYTNIPLPYEIANNLIENLKGGFFIDLKLKKVINFR